MKIENLKKLKLPDKPGVYFFYKGKEIVYIGKATSLRDRVKSYFGKDLIATRGPLLVDMIFHSDKIDCRETDSVLEALILEASLIKKYQPKYNTKEKSDKSFNYVVITKEKLPKVVIVRGKDLQQEGKNFSHLTLPRVRGGTYTDRNFSLPASGIYGPFTNGNQLREALRIIRKIFPFLDDKSKNYAEFYRQINLVPDLDDRQMYLQNIRNIKLFLNGKKKNIFKNLKKEMKSYAKMREFEKAGEIKRQLFALQHINDIALLKNDIPVKDHANTFRIEAYDIAHMSGKNMVGVMTVIENNVAVKGEYKKFKIRTQIDANDTGALLEVLERRLAHPEWMYPKLIVVDGGVAQLHTAMKVLVKAGIQIPVVSVVKDDRHRAKGILGNKKYATEYESAILLANSEAHRFAIAYHKNMRNKNFLK
jgi:excinuclease ABC subunit C